MNDFLFYICLMGEGDKTIEKFDLRGYEAFFRKYFSLFVSFANKYLGDYEQSRDVVQELFVLFWGKRADFHDEISAKVFFYKSIRNSSLNLLEHSKVKDRYNKFKQLHEDEHEFFLSSIVREEIINTVNRELDKLSSMERKVLLLSMEGKKNDEIAENLNISVNTVKTHKARAYKELRMTLSHLNTLVSLLLS